MRRLSILACGVAGSVFLLGVLADAEAKVLEVEAKPVVVVAPHRRSSAKVIPRPQREAAMDKELNCIHEHLGQDKESDWTTVCSSKESGWEKRKRRGKPLRPIMFLQLHLIFQLMLIYLMVGC